jgi:hypothetical protein
MSRLDRAHHIRNLVLFADTFAIPASSVLAYGRHERTLRALATGLARSRKSPGFQNPDSDNPHAGLDRNRP